MWEESVIYQPAKSTMRFCLYSGKPKNNPADSAYAILIKEYATDSLRYAGSRINRALNMALMTDNIAILEEEVELTKKIFPKTWKGLDSSFYGKNKKDFFDKCFNVRKK